jgi:hypothetical protein
MKPHDLLAKNLFQINLRKKKNVALPNTYDFGLNYDA